jgi:hypothetical protein
MECRLRASEYQRKAQTASFHSDRRYYSGMAQQWFVIAEGYETHFAQKQSRNNRQEVLAQVNELLWVFVRGLIGPRQIKSKQRECQTGNAWLLTNL